MTPERWHQVEELFHQALQAAPEKRAAVLAKADPELRREVEELLARKEPPGSSPSGPTTEETRTEIRPGTNLGPYRIESLLGAGGMGKVYRARDIRLGRAVAVKVCHERFNARFQREARAISALNHPNICTLHDVGPNYLVMELVEGRPLRELVRPSGLPAETAIRYGVQIADALAHTHRQDILRDLKSANVMITVDGRVKVLDFGLAKLIASSEREVTHSLTEPGTVLGTLPYMAPEVLRGEQADVRSDVWSLGVVLHEMLSGRLPFTGQTGSITSSAILTEPAPALPDRIPGGLRAVVQRCLVKDSALRYQQAAELRAALEALQPAATPAAPAVAPIPRRRWLWSIAGLAGLAAGGIFLWYPKAASDEHLTSTGEPASKNSDANEDFERAMFFIREQNDIPQAQIMLKRALERDPSFAEARRWLGFSYVIQLDGGFSNDAQLLYDAEKEVRQAQQDDPTLASAHSALGAIYFEQGRKDLAQEEIEKALQAHPDEAAALMWLLNCRRYDGKHAEAEAIARQVLLREPLFFPARMHLGDLLRTSGDPSAAIGELEKILETAPRNLYAISYLSRAYMDAGDLDKAREILERARAFDSGNYLVRLEWALLQAFEQDREEARGAMDDEVLKFARSNVTSTLEVAEFYALLGDTRQALDWLDQAVRNGDDRVEWFQRDPRLASIRNDPRFRLMLDAIRDRLK